MSDAFIQNIVGSGDFAVPDSQAELTTARTELDTLLSAIANFSYDSIAAWVTTDNVSGSRLLNCNLAGFTYSGEKCPDTTTSVALMALIQATLIADADITSVEGVFLTLANVPSATLPAHASTHENGGADEIDVTGLSGVLADPQPVDDHNTTHVHDGTDELDGDAIDISYAPYNYPRIVVPSESSSLEELASHFAGINAKFSVFGGLTTLDHFDGSSLANYSAYNLDTPGAMSKATFTDIYTNNANSAVFNTNENPETRRSWLFLQAPNTNERCVLYRADPWTGETEMLWLARMKFNQKASFNADDGDIGLFWADDAIGVPDGNNYFAIYLNKSAATIRSEFYSVAGGVPTLVGNSDDCLLRGQALEYVALQRITNDYHAWVATSNCSWLHLGSVTKAGINYSHIGLIAQNNGAIAPGTNVVACDYIKYNVGTNRFLY